MRKIILTALVVIGAAALWALRPHGSLNSNSQPPARTTAATSSPEEVAIGEKVKSGSSGVAPASPTVADNKNQKAASPEAVFAHQEELDRYRQLKKIVLGSKDDEQERARLKTDTVLLDSFRDLLKSPSTNEKTRANQNAALDLLFEALKDQSTQAKSILEGVIQDAQIESSALSPDVRENLAGIKAEALYQWSAMDPAQVSTLQSWLPGPVSQKIWQNIQERQESNLAESQMEARR